MRIIGIDPGSVRCGYAIVDKKDKVLVPVKYDIIKAKEKSELLHERSKKIFLDLDEILDHYQPDIAVIENTFYSKNVQSLIKLSYARAAATLALSLREIPIFEYSPKEIKKSVTGNGNANKEQVAFLVKAILNIRENIKYNDATDALAIAVCHATKQDTYSHGAKSWEDFIKNNPDKIVDLNK